MPEYLMVVEENSGIAEHIVRHVIEANDRQMVKYHFHKTLKEWGHSDTPYGKHCLEGANQLLTELTDVRRIDRHEYDILKKHIGSWHKVD